MSTLLTADLVADSLHSLPDWGGDTTSIHRTVAVSGDQGAELQRQVAEAADAMDHHPDVTSSEHGITFTLATHSAGGVTELDIMLASRISDLVHHVTGAVGVEAHRHDAPEITSAAGDSSGDDQAPTYGFGTTLSGAATTPLPPDEHQDHREGDAYSNERI